MATTFEDCATILLLREPFFASLFMKYKHVEDATLNPPTLCVGADTIRYHPAFFTAESEAVGVFALCHEVMHGVYMHLPRMKHYRELGIGPDGKPYDHARMNQACDYPINDALSKSGFTLWANCLHDPNKYPLTMTPEEVYCDLAKNGTPPPKPKPGSGPSGQGDGQGGPPEPNDAGFDTHDWETSADVAPAITPAEVMEAAAFAKATRGTLPAGIDRLIGEICKPSVSPWRRLRQLVTTAMSGHDASSWRRLQRKMIVRGVGMPGPIACGAGHIGIVIDVSGSIDQKMLNLFAGHMAAIIEDAKPKFLTLYWVDTRVRRTDKIHTGTQLRSMLTSSAFKAPGGGGTDMPKGVDAGLADGCDVIVVLTDGYTPFGDKSPRKVIWAITEQRINAPHGDTVHIT